MFIIYVSIALKSEYCSSAQICWVFCRHLYSNLRPTSKLFFRKALNLNRLKLVLLLGVIAEKKALVLLPLKFLHVLCLFLHFFQHSSWFVGCFKLYSAINSFIRYVNFFKQSQTPAFHKPLKNTKNTFLLWDYLYTSFVRTRILWSRLHMWSLRRLEV